MESDKWGAASQNFYTSFVPITTLPNFFMADFELHGISITCVNMVDILTFVLPVHQYWCPTYPPILIPYLSTYIDALPIYFQLYSAFTECNKCIDGQWLFQGVNAVLYIHTVI